MGAGEGAQAQVDDARSELVPLQVGLPARGGQGGCGQAFDDTAPFTEAAAWARV